MQEEQCGTSRMLQKSQRFVCSKSELLMNVISALTHSPALFTWLRVRELASVKFAWSPSQLLRTNGFWNTALSAVMCITWLIMPCGEYLVYHGSWYAFMYCVRVWSEITLTHLLYSNVCHSVHPWLNEIKMNGSVMTDCINRQPTANLFIILT